MNQLNKRIDTLVEALKNADVQMAKMGDQKGNDLNDSKKNALGKIKANGKKRSIAESFKHQINNN